MAGNVRLDLLLKEIKDVYVQENFRKIKRYLTGIEQKISTSGTGSSGGTTIINNTTISSPWDQISSVTISPSSTGVVHSVNVNNTICGEYLVCIAEQGNPNFKNFNLRYRKTDTDVMEQIYAKSGVINAHASIVRNPTTLDLVITNNELFSVDVSFTTINT